MLIRRPGRAYHRAAVAVMASSFAWSAAGAPAPLAFAVAAGLLAASLITVHDRLEHVDARYQAALDRVGPLVRAGCALPRSPMPRDQAWRDRWCHPH